MFVIFKALITFSASTSQYGNTASFSCALQMVFGPRKEQVSSLFTLKSYTTPPPPSPPPSAMPMASLLCYISLLLCAPVLARASSNLSEMEALTAFKLNAHDPLGALGGWNLYTPTAPCDWWGILCSDGRVSLLRLSRLQLGGQLTHLRHLSNLKQLDLGETNLTGGIPEEIYQCSALTSLVLSENHLSGSIPSSLSRLSNLEMLNLSSNNFTGVIPANLSNISTLQRLNLSHNNLEGEIPLMLASRFTDPSVFAMNPKLRGKPLDQKERKARFFLGLLYCAAVVVVFGTIRTCMMKIM